MLVDLLVTVANIQQSSGRVCLGSQLHGTEDIVGQQGHRHHCGQKAETESISLTDFLISPGHSIRVPGPWDGTVKGVLSWLILIGIPRCVLIIFQVLPKSKLVESQD